jgi:hypothetical protein
MSDNSVDFTELEDFMPLNCVKQYAYSLLNNNNITNREFCNNIALNVCHFYIFIIHCLLCRLYKTDEKHQEFLQYIHLTNEVFNSRDKNKSMEADIKINVENINVDLFHKMGKERGAINYFFYFLGIAKGDSICGINSDIFDTRNKVAHLNYDNIDKEALDKLIKDIVNNLSFLSKKLYKNYTREIIYSEIQEAINNDSLDESNFQMYFEEVNKNFYISAFDYKLLIENHVLGDVGNNKYKQYLKKYVTEILGLMSNDDCLP